MLWTSEDNLRLKLASNTNSLLVSRVKRKIQASTIRSVPRSAQRSPASFLILCKGNKLDCTVFGETKFQKSLFTGKVLWILKQTVKTRNLLNFYGQYILFLIFQNIPRVVGLSEISSFWLDFDSPILRVGRIQTKALMTGVGDGASRPACSKPSHACHTCLLSIFLSISLPRTPRDLCGN